MRETSLLSESPDSMFSLKLKGNHVHLIILIYLLWGGL